MGLEFGLTESFSRNGNNRYFTTGLSGLHRMPEGLTVSLDVPYIFVRTEQLVGTTQNVFLSRGLGDATVSLRCDFASVLEGKPDAPAGGEADKSEAGKAAEAEGAAEPFHAVLGLSCTMPTGSSALWYEGADGSRVYFPPDAQLGTGLWKPGISVTLFRGFGPVFPLFAASYTYARMINRIDVLHTDVANFAAGALWIIDRDLDLRLTGLALASWNVHNLKSRDRATGAWVEARGSQGWLVYAEIDAAVRVYKTLSFECGVLVPLFKTIDASPNDLGFLVKSGLRLRV